MILFNYLFVWFVYGFISVVFVLLMHYCGYVVWDVVPVLFQLAALRICLFGWRDGVFLSGVTSPPPSDTEETRP